MRVLQGYLAEDQSRLQAIAQTLYWLQVIVLWNTYRVNNIMRKLTISCTNPLNYRSFRPPLSTLLDDWMDTYLGICWKCSRQGTSPDQAPPPSVGGSGRWTDRCGCSCCLPWAHSLHRSTSRELTFLKEK